MQTGREKRKKRKRAEQSPYVTDGSPEIPLLCQLKPRQRLERLHVPSNVKVPGNLDSNICDQRDNVPGKPSRNKMKSKSRKQEMQDMVLKQIKQIIKENDQVRKRILQCSQKCNDLQSEPGIG